MPTREQLETALINADKAGDIAAAKILANALKNGEYDQHQQQAGGFVDTVPPERVAAGQSTPGQMVQTRRGMRPASRQEEVEHEGSFLNPVSQGATFGFGDEIAAGGAALYGKMFGDLPEHLTLGDIYKGILGEIRADNESYADANPEAAIAGEIAGGLASGGAIGKALYGLLPKGASLGSKVKAGAAIGATEGGLYGAGTAKEGERLKGAQSGALTGAAFGGVGAAAVDKVTRSLAKRAMDARRIQAGSADKNLAKFKVSETGGRVSDATAKNALSQGFDEGLVQQIKTSGPANQRKILKMVRVAKRSLRDNRFASRNRINQVVGDSLVERVNGLNKINKDAATRLDAVADTLKTEPFPDRTPITNFAQKLDDLGITTSIDDDTGKLVVSLDGSDIEGASDAKGFLERILNRAEGIEDAHSAHKLKRYIDRQVQYGAGTEKGLKGDALHAVKELRRGIDGVLDSTFKHYDEVNTQYSDTREALDLLQEAWGGKVDMFNASAPKQLGIQSRKLLSNYASGTNQLDAIEHAESTLAKYNIKFDDNIMDLVSAESALRGLIPQKLFNTFQGDMEKAGGNVARSVITGDNVGAGLNAVSAVKNKLSGKSPEKALDALELLLKESVKN